MKKIALGLLLAAAFCAGCSSVYNIKLSNGQVITAIGKPTLDQKRNKLIFKDASGQLSEIPAGRVVQVSPQSMDNDDSGKFKTTVKKY